MPWQPPHRRLATEDGAAAAAPRPRRRCTWVVDADLKGYFDSIPQERLMERVSEKIADGRVLGLLGRMLKAGVMESAKEWQPTETGTPQGSVLTPRTQKITSGLSG